MPDTAAPAESLYALAELAQEAGNRIDTMIGTGRSWDGDVENTLSGRIFTALDDVDVALSALIDEFVSDAAAKGGPTKGPYYRRKLLAEIKSGQHDKETG
jgi:hypothetical protein